MTEDKALTKSANVQDLLVSLGMDVRIGDVFSLKDSYKPYIQIVDIQIVEHRLAFTVKFPRSKWETSDKTYTRTEFLDKSPIKLSASIDETEKKALSALDDISSLNPYADLNEEDLDATSIVLSGGKDHIHQIQTRIQTAVEKASLIGRIVKIRVEELHSLMSTMGDQLTAIQKVIGVLELYLGVDEEIVMIREGTQALGIAPIVFRQQILHMDEESGDPRGGGIDYQKIEDFDDWIVQPENLNKVFPESKGAVALTPSRQYRHYCANPWINGLMNKKNQWLYLLIRNGEQLYRVWTNLSSKSGRERKTSFFPGPNELELMFKEGDSYWNRRDASDTEFHYKRNVMLLQGLLDRTEVFKPREYHLDLFDPTTYGDHLILVYDNEPAFVPAGYEYYEDWHKRLNEAIHQGTRVYLCAEEFSRESLIKRYQYKFRHFAPRAPIPGIYTIEEVREKDGWSTTYEILLIRWNPGDTVYGSWGEWDPHPRKNRITFELHRSDSFLLNYDLLELKDVERYINARFERHNYLTMMPVLYGIRDQRLEELEWEKEFVKLVTGRQGCSEELVWEAVQWWKIDKMKWTRPLLKDDAKALRMIESRVKRLKEA